MERRVQMSGAVLAGMLWAAQAAAVPIVYNDEAAFRAAAGSSTTYSFETHGVTESTDLASPVTAAQLDNHFDLAHTGFNLFEIVDDGADPGATDGTHFVFTHSSVAFTEYTLTFSNFGGADGAVTAFGLTVNDFASGMTTPAAITYDAGGFSGTLLSVPAGQPDFTSNFIGLTVDASEAFDSITLRFDDVESGFQAFDEVIYAQAPTPVPAPGTPALLALGAAVLACCRRRRG